MVLAGLQGPPRGQLYSPYGLSAREAWAVSLGRPGEGQKEGVRKTSPAEPQLTKVGCSVTSMEEWPHNRGLILKVTSFRTTRESSSLQDH